MTDNPFTLHLARDEAFCDREQELEDLLTHVRNGESVVLLSARRLGKSSLAGKVLEILEAEDFLTARVDVYPVSSERDFVQRLSDGIIRGIGRGADSATIGKRHRYSIVVRRFQSFQSLRGPGSTALAPS